MPINVGMSYSVIDGLLGRRSPKKPMLCHFKSDRDDIWKNCSSSKYASID